MPDTDREPNGTLENPLRDDCTKDAAAVHPVTYDQLDRTLAKIQVALEPRLNQYYERAWLHGGQQNHLFDTRNGVFFAFTPTDLFTEEPISKLDIDEEVMDAVFDAHQNQATVMGFDVDRPTDYADSLVGDFFPFFIAYPEYWLEAQHNARLRMKRLLRYDLTPTETLDYWALEAGVASLSTNQERDRWHALRGVDREAVNKTLRQARKKLDNPENQPYADEQNITVREVDDS